MYYDAAGRPVYLEKDPEKQKELMESFVSGHVVPHLSVIESHLEKNGGVLVGSDVSFQIFFFYSSFFKLKFLCFKFNKMFRSAGQILRTTLSSRLPAKGLVMLRKTVLISRT